MAAVFFSETMQQTEKKTYGEWIYMVLFLPLFQRDATFCHFSKGMQLSRPSVGFPINKFPSQKVSTLKRKELASQEQVLN